MRVVREPFSPGRDLVARKSFTSRGVEYAPGQVFDSDSVSERRLRQMYDGRWLAVAGSEEASAAEAAYEKTQPEQDTERQAQGLLDGLFGE